MAKKKKTSKKKTTAKKKKKVTKASKKRSTAVQSESDEAIIEKGKSALRRDYHRDIRSNAADILDDAQKNFSDYDEASDYIDERIRQDADGTSWVIYTSNTLDTLHASDNWLAIDDMGIEGGDLTDILTKAAYFAYEQDLRSMVDAMKDDYFQGSRDDNPRTQARVAPSATSSVKKKLLR